MATTWPLLGHYLAQVADALARSAVPVAAGPLQLDLHTSPPVSLAPPCNPSRRPATPRASLQPHVLVVAAPRAGGCNQHACLRLQVRVLQHAPATRTVSQESLASPAPPQGSSLWLDSCGGATLAPRLVIARAVRALATLLYSSVPIATTLGPYR